MDENTKKILADMKKKGLDTSSIERQLEVNPILSKEIDGVIGNAGILRQADYTRYMNETKELEQRVQAQAQQLATLHDAAKVTSLPQEALDTITALEGALIDTGLFTEDSIKEISALGRRPLIELANNPPPNPNPGNGNNNPPNNERKDEMTFDESKFVDTDTFKSALANIAYGGIATSLQIQAAIDEVKALGIPVDRAKIAEFQSNLKADFDKGNASLDDVVEKTFKVSEVRQAKATEDFNRQIEEAKQQGRAEALKESGVPQSRASRLLGGRQGSPLFGRKSTVVVDSSANQNANGANYKNDKGQVDIANLPKNEVGDPKLFLARGDRSSRVAGALNFNDELMEKVAADPLSEYA